MPGQKPTRTKLILAGVAGNVLEWYDFAVYGYFALIIGKLSAINAQWTY